MRRTASLLYDLSATGLDKGGSTFLSVVEHRSDERYPDRVMRVDAFDFLLPEDLIALRPAARRDEARLLHAAGGTFADRRVRDLPELIKPGDVLVFNDSRVIPAQLLGDRAPRSEGGGGSHVRIDATLIRRLADDDGGSEWQALVRPAKRLREGDEIQFAEGLSAVVVDRRAASARLRFNVAGEAFNAALREAGAPPLPPYIARRRSIVPEDAVRYQTVYAAEEGSVAAPTAGLHFTDDLLNRLSALGVARVMTTLHVGAGTFLPVAVEDTRDHVMHAEWGEITQDQAATINAAKSAGGRVIAVGTTALRLVESAADEGGLVGAFRGETDIFITPGYKFRCVDVLMTNFHLPRSTLFMLVSAFCGLETIQRAYAHAIEERYRFYSYGDASFLERGA